MHENRVEAVRNILANDSPLCSPLVHIVHTFYSACISLMGYVGLFAMFSCLTVEWRVWGLVAREKWQCTVHMCWCGLFM
jgi:hypothetical protein